MSARQGDRERESLVRFESVGKTYRTTRGRRVTALDDFTMTIPRGALVGLLGPNGSGKTTALKALLGLIRPTSGTISAFGRELPREQKHVAARMGALIEGPAFTASLTGRHNLALLATLRGVGANAVTEALDVVGLSAEAADRRYSGYSLGMKQRLGVAAAMLARPELLVLDEPMNGLDPEAVREMRGLLLRLRAEFGMTVIVSSHILAEVEQVCDWITIVSNGRCITDASTAELLARGRRRLVLRVDDLAATTSALTERGHSVILRNGPRGDEVCVDDGTEGAEILKALAAHDIYPHEMVEETAGLEELYVQAVRNGAP